MAEKSGVEVPTTTMVSATQAVYGSEDIRRDAGTTESDGGGSSALLPIVGLGGILATFGIIGFAVMRFRRSGAANMSADEPSAEDD